MEVLTKPTVSVTNDFFFKFSLSGEDDISKELRETMIYEFTGIQCKESTVLNSEFPTNPLSEKAIYVDVLVKDKNNNMFNIEMQAYNTGYEYLRFQYYTIRIASAQIKTGEEYYKLKPIHQVIFYNRNPEGKQKLIKHFSLSINYGEQIPQNIPNIIVIYIPMIQKVVNDKGFDYLNDIEKYCYLLYNGSIDKQDNSNYGKLVELTMKKYDEFKKEKNYSHWLSNVNSGKYVIVVRWAQWKCKA